MTLLYGNNSEYWHISVEFLFISSSNNEIRSGVVGKEIVHALFVVTAVDGIETWVFVVVNNERFCWSCVCWSEYVSTSQQDDDDEEDDDDDVVDEVVSIGSKSVVESISGSTAWS